MQIERVILYLIPTLYIINAGGSMLLWRYNINLLCNKPRNMQSLSNQHHSSKPHKMSLLQIYLSNHPISRLTILPYLSIYSRTSKNSQTNNNLTGARWTSDDIQQLVFIPENINECTDISGIWLWAWGSVCKGIRMFKRAYGEVGAE